MNRQVLTHLRFDRRADQTTWRFVPTGTASGYPGRDSAAHAVRGDES